MKIDDDAVRELGLDLKQTPEAIELRLPSAVGCINAAGLGFFGLIALVFPTALLASAWRATGGSFVPVILAATAAVGVLALLHRVRRWLRYGAVVRITPDQVVIRKHWSSGEEALAIELGQARFVADRRGILVAGGRRTTRIGTGLRPGARGAVAEFLSLVVAGHLAEQARGTWAAADPSEAASLGAVPFAAAADDPSSGLDADLLLLSLCRRCQQADAGRVRTVHVAPDIPPGLLTAALETYLEVRDDEVLLAILGVPESGPASIGCALTTRRVYWPGRMAAPAEGRPPRCCWLDYSGLPESIEPAGLPTSGVALGRGRRIRMGGGRKLRGALIALLETARSLARGAPPDPALWQAAGLEPYGHAAPFLRDGVAGPSAREAEQNAARWAWPRVVAASREARSHHAEIRGFQGRFLAARPIVTPALVAACFVVYALTLAASLRQHPGQFWPDLPVMLAWGADFGPATLIDGETWRTFTNMFLHFGLMHLLFNMYCLATAGPVVERLFGHVGFAGLYVLSGLGGSIASLCYHPTVISAGASGAIFGVFGALLGFLALRHGEVPSAKLKPMAGGALAFVGYNTIFSLSVPGIDMAAHFGGLVVGLACGLLLTAATPARPPSAGRLVPALGRLGVLLACSAALAVAWPKAAAFARGRLLADPQVARPIAAQREAIDAWNAYNAAAEPVLRDFDAITGRLNDLLRRAEKDRISDDEAARTIAGLDRDCRGLVPRIDGLPAANAEIREIRRRLGSAQALLLRMIAAVAEAVRTGDPSRLDGPRGLSASNDAYVREFEAIRNLRDAYFRTHDMQPVNKSR